MTKTVATFIAENGGIRKQNLQWVLAASDYKRFSSEINTVTSRKIVTDSYVLAKS